MLSMGIVVGLGLIVIFVKLSWAWRMRMLSNPVVVDVLVFGVLTAVHWGTFSGVMVATVGALFTSIVLSAGRWAFGYVDNGSYVRGALADVRSKL